VGIFSLARISGRWQFDQALDLPCEFSLHPKSDLDRSCGITPSLRDVTGHYVTFKRLGYAGQQKSDFTEYRKQRFVECSRKRKRRNQMKPSPKDQIKGEVHEVKGNVKETAGQVTNDANLETQGQNEKLAGKVQKKVGQIEKVLEK